MPRGPRIDDLLAGGRIKRHDPSSAETGDLLALAIELLPVLLGERQRRGAIYLDACRRKRNIAEYERADATTPAEAKALGAAVRELQIEVLAWLTEKHPELIGAV